MAIQGRDPSITSPLGGYEDVLVKDVGNGLGAIVTLAATRTKTTVAGATVSTQLLAADSTRILANVVNTDTSKTMYIGLNGAAAVVGTNPVLPNAGYCVPAANVTGQLNAIWDTGVTGGASVTALTV